MNIKIQLVISGCGTMAQIRIFAFLVGVLSFVYTTRPIKNRKMLSILIYKNKSIKKGSQLFLPSKQKCLLGTLYIRLYIRPAEFVTYRMVKLTQDIMVLLHLITSTNSPFFCLNGGLMGRNEQGKTSFL